MAQGKWDFAPRTSSPFARFCAEFYEEKIVTSKVEFLSFVRACIQLGQKTNLGCFELTDCDSMVEPGSTIGILLREQQLNPSILRQDRVQCATAVQRRLKSMAGITFVGLQEDSQWRGKGDEREEMIDTWLFKDTCARDAEAEGDGAQPEARSADGLESVPRLHVDGAEEDGSQQSLASRQTSVDFNRRIKVRVLTEEELKGDRLAQAVAATKHDLTEFYHEVGLIRDFGRDNHAALCKVFKKYRKNVGGHMHELPAIRNLLDSCDFYVSNDSFTKTEAEHLLQEVEQLYMLSFTTKDGTAKERRKNTIAALHVGKSNHPSIITKHFRCGLLAGAASAAVPRHRLVWRGFS